MTAQARPITSVTITPASSVTYALTNYVFSITTLDPIPTGGKIEVTFPSTITLGIVNLTSSSFSNTNCMVGIIGNAVTLSSCFSSPLASGVMTLNLSKIYNPPSLQPTAAFSIVTSGPLGNVNYINSSLSITMSTPATTNSFTVNPASKIVHALTTYTLTFTFAVPHQIGDYFTFSIDSTMSISSLSCNATSGVASIGIFLLNSTSINITFTAIPQNTVQIDVSSIRNYDISSTGIPFNVFFYNSANYPM